MLNIVSCLSPPPLSFAIFSLHIEYLLLVLFSSAVIESICTLFYSYVFRFGLHSVLLFAVLWFVWGQFYKNVIYIVLADFSGYIKYLLFVLLNSTVEQL